jgi:hypothetical protein
MKAKRLTEEQKKQILNLRDQNISIDKISMQLLIPVYRIKYFLSPNIKKNIYNSRENKKK